VINLLKKHIEPKYYLLALAILFFAVIPLFLNSAYYLHTAIMVLFWAYLASAWNIIGGFAGRLALGHGAYVATGAYVSSILFKYVGISPWFGMIIGGVAAALLGFIVGYPTLRLRGAYYALATVAFAQGVTIILLNTTEIGSWHTGGAEGFIIPLLGEAPIHMQFISKVPYYYIMLVLLIIIIAVNYWIDRNKLGFYLTAIREDEDAALVMGVNTTKIKITAAVLSAFFVGVGGVFYAQLIRYLEPHAIAGEIISQQMVFCAIVGGRGTVLGPVLGGIVLTLVGETSRNLFHQAMGLHLFIYGVIVVLIVMFKPTGIIDICNQIYEKVIGILEQRGTENEQTTSTGIKKSNH
jgi:branched-chain amino acid transport system permease protein